MEAKSPFQQLEDLGSNDYDSTYEERNEQNQNEGQPADKMLFSLRSFIQGGVWSARSKPMLEWTLYRDGRTTRRKYNIPTGSEDTALRASEARPQTHNASDPGYNSNSFENNDIAVTIRIGTGTGHLAYPFSVTSQDALTLFREWGFSPRFLRRLKGKAELFEHLFSCKNTMSQEPKYSSPIFTPDTLELALSSFEVNSLHIFGIYSLTQRTAHFLIFLKASAFFRPNRVWRWLEDNTDILISNPILVPNVITTGIQLYVHNFATWRAFVNDMEARIGVTTENRLLATQGFTKESLDLDLLNNALSTLKKIIAEHELATLTQVQQTKALMRVIETAERFYLLEFRRGNLTEPGLSEASEELHGTITRAEIYLQNLQIMQNILQNHTAALYNRINQHDNSLNLAVSQNMKTIAVVTLIYLPPTFVATLFSTSIFDFGLEVSSDGTSRHVSGYWWVLATICTLLTLITLVMWALWYQYGRKWTDSLLALIHKDEKSYKQ